MTPLPLSHGQAWTVITADTLTLLPQLPDQCIDAVVCDPPYGIDFQQAAWDGRTIRTAGATAAGRPLTSGQAFEQWTGIWARELARVVKPGGHIACFAAPRMTHRLTSGLEDAGLEIRDVLMWLYGTGMPKSRRLPGGRGTALKPAYEPIVLARTPLAGTTAATAATWGTGVLNTEACAIPDPASSTEAAMVRWPANVCLTHQPGCQSGRCSTGCAAGDLDRHAQRVRPSRFFYCGKASRRERDAGCQQLPAKTLDLFPSAAGRSRRQVRNPHPTVKPIELMRWLTRLITPEGGVVLDPFCGSGSTGCAATLERRLFIGIERDPDHAQVARARITHHHPKPAAPASPAASTPPTARP
ncbi:site-specific DNA-methyltransferase [Paraconexibacter antarcticus]|uniref:Methyltransferase n=1 Tax=Paraconexibacter antarcticus TaxID=2949664 RepID=A0ABY5DPG4_9ACTN|nr:site-specific DNA-methyltransferase [Paraconexibacter antarcticus]UTI63923.1 site-specific DNA-methyltransferase [Paraconexibacter antarcticus]